MLDEPMGRCDLRAGAPRRLILAGGGHSHLEVLHALLRRRPPNVEIVLVTPSPALVYSGMTPGWMAGHYRLDDIQIELRPLAQAAGARLMLDQVGGVDAQRRYVVLASGEHLEYDVLSLNIGAQSDVSLLHEAGARLLPVRPLEAFIAHWPAVIAATEARRQARVVVVGAGAGGVELAFAARHALAQGTPDSSVALIASDDGLLPGHARGVAARVAKRLAMRGIAVRYTFAVGASGGVALADGEVLNADCVIAATGGAAPAWLRLSQLALDAEGYVCVNARHQSVSHPNVFAAGDICARADRALAHSGVNAVRAGAVLARNLIHALTSTPLEEFHPRKRSLYLLATGPRHAVASWGRFSASGRWVWRLKDWIDRRFIRRHRLGEG